MRQKLQTFALLLLLGIYANDLQAQQTAALQQPKISSLAHAGEQKAQQSKSLESVLNEIQERYQVILNYDFNTVKGKTVKEYELNEDVDASLKNILKAYGLQYEKLKDNFYIIYENKKTLKKAKKQAYNQIGREVASINPLQRMALQSADEAAYEKTITGKVSDENSEPLPGVNVVVKNTTIGTVTDIDGNYRLSVPDDARTLVFSSVGYTSEEVAVGNQSVINLTLVPDVQSLSEVVVVGYGTQKKSDLTGAVSTVKSEELNRISERRLETALQGRAAGVTVSRGEGEPGAPAKVSIRGVGTFNNNGPLYVIDGVPQDPGTNFNPQDVESIEVLKDASAAAIYGARAAHGVVLITTKRGEAGKINVNVNSSAGIREGLNLPDFLNTPDFITLATEARNNSGIAPESSWSDPSALPDTDWGDAVFRRAIEQSHNISVAGGNENANFYISGAYDREEGIYIDSDFERYSFRANSDFKIGKILKIGESFLFTRTRNNPTAEDNRELNFVLRAVPTFPIYDPSNPVGGWGQTPSYNNGSNPVGIQEQTNAYNVNRAINGNMYAELEPMAGLRLRGSVGYNYGSGLFRAFIEEYDYRSVVNPDASLRYLSNDNESYNLNLVLSYDKSLGDHNFSALIGTERYTSDGLRFDAQATGFPVAYAESFNLSDGEFLVPERNTIGSRYRLNSLFGRISYDYQGKYLFQGNIRRDGSSRFGENNKYGVFPSVSVGWRVSDEGFMDGVSWVSDLKLRASYGILGSDRIGDFNDAAYTTDRSIYIFNATGVDGGAYQTGFYLDAFTNANRKWEEVKQIDIGVDAGFLENKLNVTLDYYDKTTNDLLVPVQLPLSFGVSSENAGPSSVPVNVGSLQNKGVELAVNYRHNFNDLRIDLNANGAYNKNEIIALADDSPIDRSAGGPNNPRVSGTISRTVVGEPLGAFYGLIVDGIFQDQTEVDAVNEAAPDGVYQENGTAPGDFRYRDLDGDGEITEDDRDFLGDPFPKFTYGLSATLTYKSVDFSVFFQGITGVEVFNANKAYFNTFYSDFNSTSEAFNRWTPENPTNSEPRLTTNDPNGNFQKPSSYFVEDGSYLKLRNIQLGYNLPEAALSSIGFTKARIYVNAQNILTFTNYSGLDPELSNGDGGNTLQGLDGLGRYPMTYLISAGVQLGF